MQEKRKKAVATVSGVLSLPAIPPTFPLPGCHTAVQDTLQQALLLKLRSYGSEDNSNLYWLAKVVIHNLCISLYVPCTSVRFSCEEPPGSLLLFASLVCLHHCDKCSAGLGCHCSQRIIRCTVSNSK